MRRRVLLTVAVATFVGALTLNLLADETHVGKVVAVGKNTITVLDDRDMDNDKFEVTAETKLTKNGKPCALKDIAVGDRAKITARSEGDKLIALTVDTTAPE